MCVNNESRFHLDRGVSVWISLGIKCAYAVWFLSKGEGILEAKTALRGLIGAVASSPLGPWKRDYLGLAACSQELEMGNNTTLRGFA